MCEQLLNADTDNFLLAINIPENNLPRKMLIKKYSNAFIDEYIHFIYLFKFFQRDFSKDHEM